MAIEPLESRIAPAAVTPLISPNGHSATWTDIDGDAVTLTVTKGKLTADVIDLEGDLATGKAILQELKLTDASFAGSAVAVTAKRTATGGDGSVNVGYINATDNTLKSVFVAGDLTKIDAGKQVLTNKTPKAVGTLTAKSMGLFGDSLLDTPVPLVSELSGAVGPIKISGNVKGVLISAVGGDLGTIQSINIGGSLIGTDDADSGRIVATGKIGAVTIRGSILGGAGQNSGGIESGAGLQALILGGSIVGGKGANPSNNASGFVHAEGAIGNVMISGGIYGGTQQGSGVLSGGDRITNLIVKGSIVGGDAGTTSGVVSIAGDAGVISVSGNVTGGNAVESGKIEVLGNVNNLMIGGAVRGGGEENTGSVSVGGTLKIGKVLGGLFGGTGEGSGAIHTGVWTNGMIAVGMTGGAGEGSGSVTSDGDITSLTVNGFVLGGSGDDTGRIQSNGTLKLLTITGDLVGGDLASDATASLLNSGSVQAKSIGTIIVKGSLRAGIDYNSTNDIVNGASIRSENEIRGLNIQGDVLGNEDARVVVTAHGQSFVPVNTRINQAMGNLRIGGSVNYTDILAGYDLSTDLSTATVNPDAQILTLSVGGDWVASNLVAGADFNSKFGDGNDHTQAGLGSPDIFARIGGIAIAGQIVGTADDASDHFGFIAEQIVSFKLGTARVTPPPALPPVGKLVPLPPPAGPNGISLNTGPRDDNDLAAPKYNLGSTGDVRLFEFTA